MLNSRYKAQFKAYQKYMKDDPNGTTLCILLNNASIQYINTPFLNVVSKSTIIEYIPLRNSSV